MFDSEKNEEKITFDTLCDTYIEASSFASPAELHGLLCGKLSSGKHLDNSTWLNAVEEQMDLNNGLNEKARNMFVELYAFTYQQLTSSDFSFAPLLPDDMEPLSMRLECLSQWCRGFLTGYGLGGIGKSLPSKEEQSVLLDFSQIVKVNTDIKSTCVTNEDERDFTEVIQYVRMAAITLFDKHQ